MKPEEKEQEEALRREKLLEFHKPKPPENKNKNEKEPSPHAPLIPCIKCGKTHRKGAKCKL